MTKFWADLTDGFAGWMPQLLWACLQTLQLTALTFIVAVPLGLIIVWMRLSTHKPLKWVAVALIEVARGTPALVILFVVYFGLPSAFPGLSLNSLTAAVVGLGLQGGAILAEIFRSGIEAIDRGQREASLTIGLTPRQAMIDVIAPQAWLIVLPPVGNYVVGLLKDTSIASIIAAPELMLRAKDLASSSFMPMQLYVLAALLYFMMSYPLSQFFRHLERRTIMVRRTQQQET
jgi:His/Glu/Gln/Arg/opine family amino acid ABC transporter permease subunit